MESTLMETQMDALKQFKNNVSDILTPNDTDLILLKWLRARNYNVRKAEIYFREMYAFRQMYEIDILHEIFTKPKIAEKYEYTAYLGFAKDGSIVRYSHFGLGDHLGYIMSMSAFTLCQYACYTMGQDLLLQRQENKRTGKEVNEITYIFDMEGFAIQSILHKCLLEMAFDLGQMVQEYYPEVWGNIFFINAPSYFDMAYNIFKPIIRQAVVQKLQVASKESTAQLLLKYIDADVLPAFLGGKRVDSNDNPRCTEFLRFGGKVPPECYLCNQITKPLMPSDPDVKELWIAARGVFNYSMVARKPSSTIRIEFRTECGSIHLRVLYRKLKPESEIQDVPGVDEYLDERDDKTNVKLISPGMWIQSHLAPADNSCKAPWPGIYIFRFSNGRSLFGSRHLIYRIRLIE